jgi:hypothetical protein
LKEGIKWCSKNIEQTTKDLKGLKEGIKWSKNTKQTTKDLKGLKEGIKSSENKQK